jgi:hypothetical protein
VSQIVEPQLRAAGLLSRRVEHLVQGRWGELGAVDSREEQAMGLPTSPPAGPPAQT